MISNIYKNIILQNPKTILIFIILTALFFGYNSKDFRLDASSETLLIEGDPDLKYLQEINEKFGSKDFLVLTLTPNESIISDNVINNILSLKYKIQSLDSVYDEFSILFATPENSPEQSLDDKQVKDALKKAIRSLNQREAMIVQLYYVEEMNVYEIAEVLEISTGRISQIKKTIVQKLRNSLHEEIRQ